MRGIVGKGVDHGEAELSPMRVPIPFPQLVGSKLDVSGEHVFAIGRECGIKNRRNSGVKIRCARKFTVLGIIESAFQIINVRTDMNAAGKRSQRMLIGLERGETWQPAESEIDFGDITPCAEVLDAIREDGIELRRVDEVKEGALRIDAGSHGFRGDFFSALENNSRDGTILNANLLDFRIRTDLHACFLGGLRERARERAKAATRESRGTNRVDVRSGAKKQDCGRS